MCVMKCGAWLACAAGMALGLARVAAADPGQVKLTTKPGVIEVQINGKPFTEYRFASEPGMVWSKPYFYPVRAADGTEVTADQSRLNTKEHPHHRSLWVGQGAVNGFDHWAHAKDPSKQPEQRNLKIEASGDTITEQLAWTDPQGKPMLNEARTWRFFADGKGSPGIDLTSVYTAIDQPVLFGSTKEAGLVAVRLNKSIADSCVITLSGGETSSVNADKAKKSKGDEANVWGKAADWCDLSGKVGDKTYGVVVFDNPANPHHPSTWHVRRYGLLAANIFGLHDFDKEKYPDEHAGEMKLEPGKPTTFKYRVLVHAGPADPKAFSDAYAAYAQGH